MWIVKLTEYNTSKTLCCLNIEWAASSPLYKLFFFLSTSNFVHYKSSNSTSFLYSFSIWKKKEFKKYLRHNLFIPSVPRRTHEAVQQETPLTAFASNNLRLSPHVPLQFLSILSLSPDVLWPSFLFFFFRNLNAR